jgi:hypothetical protein
MIVALGGNDVLRGTAPEVARANLDGILSMATARHIPVLLIGIDVPENYGADYKAQFSEIYPDLANKYNTLYSESFLGPLTTLGSMTDILEAYFQPDGIHPNATGVSIIVEAIGPMVADLAQRSNGAIVFNLHADGRRNLWSKCALRLLVGHRIGVILWTRKMRPIQCRPAAVKSELKRQERSFRASQTQRIQ